MTTRIGIMGAGALGSYVGAFLARAGEDVTMVDMWPEHVETMKRDGLRASGSQGDFTVPINALHLTEAQNIVDQFDFAFISLKSYDTEWATHFIKRYVKPDGCFVSLQNCWNDPTVGDIVGPERAMGCIASHIEVALWEPGHVQRGGAVGRDSGHVVFRVGEQTLQVTDRSQYVAGLLDNIDAAYATDNLWGERWAKLCQNSMGNAISAMTGMGTNELAVDKRCRTISINLAREAAQVGLALGYDVVAINDKPAQLWADSERGDAYEELDNFFANRRTRVNWLASMAQDVHKGRRSEVAFMNGLVCAKGQEVSIPTPYNDSIVSAMQLIDDKVMPAGPELIDIVLEGAGAG